MRSRLLAAISLYTALATGVNAAPPSTLGSRMGDICDTALSVKLTSFPQGLELEDTVGAFTFTRTSTSDYLIVGVPYDVPADAPVVAVLHGGTPVQILKRLSPTIAVGRVPAGATTLITNLGQSSYREDMTVPVALYDSCTQLGARVRTRGSLLPDEEPLAAQCGSLVGYEGPQQSFFCPRMDGETSWGFLNMVDVGYVRGPNAAVPGAYLAYVRGGSSGDRWSEALGLPVFDPTGEQSVALGVVTRATPLMDDGTRVFGFWEVNVGPIESIMSEAIEVAYAAERDTL